jgi:predicted transposase YbfD/YdcC
MLSAPKKTAQTIIKSQNDYLGALKGNQSGLLDAVQVHFQAQQTVQQINKGHGRIEKRTISISDNIETAQAFAERIRGYWGFENKVHYVRDVTQGEDASRIRTPPLAQNWALARNFALNLFRHNGFDNMAQAQRLAGFGLSTLLALFGMK